MNAIAKHWILLGRISLAIVYVWFGALKVIGNSPAHDLVASLAEQTLPFVNPDTFTTVFGVVEVLLGIGILVRAWDRVVIPLILLHLVTTMGPLVILPDTAWESGAPTLIGQYIIKNLVLGSLALAIYAEDRKK